MGGYGTIKNPEGELVTIGTIQFKVLKACRHKVKEYDGPTKDLIGSAYHVWIYMRERNEKIQKSQIQTALQALRKKKFVGHKGRYHSSIWFLNTSD